MYIQRVYSSPKIATMYNILASFPGRSYTNLLSIVDSDFSLLEAACPSRLLEGLTPQFGMQSSLCSEVVICRGIFQTPQ